MTLDESIKVLKIAIDYIDKSGNCDDKPLDYPNGDEMRIALNNLVEIIKSKNDTHNQ